MSSTDFKALAVRLLEANQEQLDALEFQAELPLALEIYRQALLHASRGDTTSLTSLLGLIRETSARWESEMPCLEVLVNLRLRYLTGELEGTEAPPPSVGADWKGEFFLICAAALERKLSHASAIEAYKTAAKHYFKQGARGRSLRARFNAVTLVSHVDPKKNLVREYFALIREARKLRQFIVMATACLNISREYQRLGALRMALKFSNKGIALCSPDLGGQVYYLSIAHRAHVLIELGRSAEARTDFEEASTAEFPEVRAAVAVLAKLLGQPASLPPGEQLHPSWRERLAESRPGAAPPRFGANEEKLLEFVSAKPRNKFDIMAHLFGEKIDPFVAENRLKNVIFRIRKKAPGLLLFENDSYFLAEGDAPVRRSAG